MWETIAIEAHLKLLDYVYIPLAKEDALTLLHTELDSPHVGPSVHLPQRSLKARVHHSIVKKTYYP